MVPGGAGPAGAPALVTWRGARAPQAGWPKSRHNLGKNAACRFGRHPLRRPGALRGLDPRAVPGAHPRRISRPGGRSGPRGSGEESPGSMERRCRITSGGGDPRDSATESRPPRIGLGRSAVRVKGCGKSAPRTRQRGRHGKPHREQNRIGATRRTSRSARPSLQARRPGWLLEAVGNDRPRGMAATSGDREVPGPYRTRLIGRLIPSPFPRRRAPRPVFATPSIRAGSRRCRRRRVPITPALHARL